MALGKVVSLGVHILDVLGRPVVELPPGQGSAFIDEIRATAAGTAAGTSVDLARLGVEVFSAGAIGDDALGDLLLNLLGREGVDTGFVVRKPGQRTSATILPIRPNGDRPALHAAGAALMFERSDIGPELVDAIRTADILHVGGPDALGEFAGKPLQELVCEAKDAGTLVTVDVLRPGKPEALERLAPILEMCDWFLPNEDQLCRLTGQAGLAEALVRAREIGAFGLAVTRGAAGCIVSYRDLEQQMPAIPVAVVDTTGCGDAFDAGFIAGLLLGCGPAESAWLGISCGSLVATGLGSDAGLRDLETALELIARVQPAIAASIQRALNDAPGSQPRQRTI